MLDLDGGAPSLCLTPTLPSLLPHPKTFEISGFCLIYLLLDPILWIQCLLPLAS